MHLQCSSVPERLIGALQCRTERPATACRAASINAHAFLYQTVRRVDRRASHAIERGALDVDHENRRRSHGALEPNESSGRTAPGVEQQPLARLPVARARDAHRLLRRSGRSTAPTTSSGALSATPLACSQAIALLHREHRDEAAVVAHGQRALIGNHERRPALGLADDALEQLGVEAQDGALETGRRRARRIALRLGGAWRWPRAAGFGGGSPRNAMRRSPPASRMVMPSGRTATSVAPCAISCPCATSRGPDGKRKSA